MKTYVLTVFKECPSHVYVEKKAKYLSGFPSGLVKEEYLDNFSYLSTKTYIIDTHQKCLTKALLVSTNNIGF